MNNLTDKGRTELANLKLEQREQGRFKSKTRGSFCDETGVNCIAIFFDNGIESVNLMYVLLRPIRETLHSKPVFALKQAFSLLTD